ncbi:MAG: hypothetical protein GYA42_05760 [Syntrophomonadaceae bacterium]|nr:hypothetical protein [Syntrophomonadaceae bacterium]
MFELANISMVVRDIEKSVRFYGNMLDFTVSKQKRTLSSTVAHLKHGNIVLELIQYTKAESSPYPAGVIDHLTFMVEDLKGTVDKLRRRGVEFETSSPLQSFDGSQIMFLKGPDGERIAIVNLLGR